MSDRIGQSQNRFITGRSRRRSQQGQSLLVALGVLLILSFVGAVFVAVIGRNLQNSLQSNRTSSADTFAQAGIDFADKMLQTAPEGADWRPPLQYTSSTYTGPGTSTLTSPDPNDPDKQLLSDGYTRYNVGNGRFLLRISYLNEFGNDASVNTPPPGAKTPVGAPIVQTTTSKFLKIESVGLEGTVNATDPTVVTAAGSNRRSKRIAYKPICLGDYSRFFTNRFNRTDAASIGFPSLYTTPPGETAARVVTPGVQSVAETSPSVLTVKPQPVAMTFGLPNAYVGPTGDTKDIIGGGGIRSNTDLRLYGILNVYLNPRYGEAIETSGRLLFDGYNQANNGSASDRVSQPSQLIVNIPDASSSTSTQIDTVNLYPTNAVTSSGSSLFSTDQGVVRDGMDSSDTSLMDNTNTNVVAQAGYPRSVKRRNPPVIDLTDPQTNLSRYAALARIGTSGTLGTPYSSSTSGTSSTSSTSGTGTQAGYSGPYKSNGALATVYVDNFADLQTESEQFTMRDQWINRADPQRNGYWRGPIYSPPGAVVTFGMVPGTKQWGVTIVRSDANAAGVVQWNWNNDDGTTSSLQANRMRFVYDNNGPQDTNGNPYYGTPNDPVFSLNANAPAGANPTTYNNFNNDVLIYTEGNVRVHGVISQPSNTAASPSHHITLVTNGIAYIDGCILKGNYVNAGGSPSSDFSGLNAANPTPPVSTSSVAILARQYVTVNTTQFFPGTEDPQADQNSANVPPTLIDSGWEFRTGQSLNMDVLYPQLYYSTTAAPTTDEKLFISASGEPADAFGQVVLSDPMNDPQNAAGSLTTIFPGASGISMLPSPSNGMRNVGVSLPQHYPGTPTTNNYDFGFNAAPFLLNFSVNQARSSSNWVVHRAVVLPGDIRIEAMIYAQNNSFFVIPGDWFNPSSADTPENLLSRNTDSSTGMTDIDFPAYGQPIDLKITVVGSITENLPADIADQQAWMQKWGWIPQYHGGACITGTSPSSPHWTVALDPNGTGVVPGLTYQYDPLEGFPLLGVNNLGGTGSATAPQYIRVDRFGRPLPFVPNLPVSPDLVYSGLAN